LCGSARDDVRYHLPAEFLEKISWLAMFIVIPILNNTIGTTLANFLNRTKNKKVLQADSETPRYIKGPRTKNDARIEQETVSCQQEELIGMKRELLIIYPKMDTKYNSTD
jgi:hypothetical protein